MRQQLQVRCLRCGAQHRLEQVAWQHVQQSECPRCGYLGWAEVEPERQTVPRLVEPRRLGRRR